jgi:protein tyrosine phosphatase
MEGGGVEAVVKRRKCYATIGGSAKLLLHTSAICRGCTGVGRYGVSLIFGELLRLLHDLVLSTDKHTHAVNTTHTKMVEIVEVFRPSHGLRAFVDFSSTRYPESVQKTKQI